MAPPRPKAGGKKPTGKFWRTFHSTIQELKMLNRFYILRLQPFSATLKTIYLRGCGCYTGKFSLPQMLRAATAEACNQQSMAFYHVTAAAKKHSLSAECGGLPALSRWAASPHMPAAGVSLLRNSMPRAAGDCHQQVTALIVTYRARAKRGPGRASINPIMCHCPNVALLDLSLLPPASLLSVTLGKAGGIRD